MREQTEVAVHRTRSKGFCIHALHTKTKNSQKASWESRLLPVNSIVDASPSWGKPILQRPYFRCGTCSLGGTSPRSN